jgi:hypothetical protein
MVKSTRFSSVGNILSGSTRRTVVCLFVYFWFTVLPPRRGMQTTKFQMTKETDLGPCLRSQHKNSSALIIARAHSLGYESPEQKRKRIDQDIVMLPGLWPCPSRPPRRSIRPFFATRPPHLPHWPRFSLLRRALEILAISSPT